MDKQNLCEFLLKEFPDKLVVDENCDSDEDMSFVVVAKPIDTMMLRQAIIDFYQSQGVKVLAYHNSLWMEKEGTETKFIQINYAADRLLITVKPQK